MIIFTHNAFKKIIKNIKKVHKLIDNKYVFCYINNQVMKTLNRKRMGCDKPNSYYKN
ncbi:hypothetical protein GCM10023261_17910 [Bartonella jaculi]|uniref:Uncharacterized protein n=1 Tax=Bartonella jaculi TaxID=686226 RepID=A0ABP9NE36_9HYPH